MKGRGEWNKSIWDSVEKKGDEEEKRRNIISKHHEKLNSVWVSTLKSC